MIVYTMTALNETNNIVCCAAEICVTVNNNYVPSTYKNFYLKL